MKGVRIVFRIGLIAAVAVVFVFVTVLTGTVVRGPDPMPRGRMHRRSAPEISEVGEFLGEGLLIAGCAVVGRLVFRLRLVGRPKSIGGTKA